ncbi:MAG TPA: hypothetical protein VG672_17360 [Bryobacteraceae bacterium]|nr:hypothetical protein [Bryobacteraceae bacterium]HWB98485.1 hypothetical protein [Bryobacteraceae bacterium]
MNPDTVQHINVKVFASGDAPGEVVNVFHRWIKESACPELLIDVAEYNHVPAGPGVLLIGLEANYSLDNRENRPGLVYNRKASDEGTFQEKLAQAHAAAIAACDRLEKETSLKFDRNNLEVFVNDRALAPNTNETWQALEPELRKYFPKGKIEKVGEPRDLFRVSIST